MKLSVGTGQGKNQTVIAIVAIVVILIAIVLLARNFMGGGNLPPPPGPPGAPGGQMNLPPGAGRRAPVQSVPSAEPAPSAARPAAAPSSPPPASAPAANARPPVAKPEPANTQPVPSGPTRQIKVFGSVNVTYPAKWKISAGAGNSSAIFTDGNASLAVYPPDPKADSAKKIAQSVIARGTPGAAVTKEGAANVSGYDTYWFAVKFSGKVARVVGIDAPTRIALVETVKSGDFGKYAPAFDKMQSGITFSGK